MELPTLVFDATGNAHSMNGAFHLVANGGKLVFVGLFPGDITFNDPEFHRRELTVLATRNSTAAEFARIITEIEAGRIDTRTWITHRCRLDRMPSELDSWLDPAAGVIKAMIEL